MATGIKARVEGAVAAWLQKLISLPAVPQTGTVGFDSDIGTLGLGGLAPQRWNPRQLVIDGYARNPTVFSAVQHVARAAAGVPWLLYRRTSTSGSKSATIRRVMTAHAATKALSAGQQHRARLQIAEIEEHPLLQLMERPNPVMGGAELIEAITSHLLITGNSYTFGVTTADDAPSRELWPLMPAHMKAILSATGDVVQYNHIGGGVESHLDARDVLHLKTFNPLGDSVYGFPPLIAAALAVDSDNEAARWNCNLLRNSARPSGALAFERDRPLSAPMMDKVAEDIRKHYASARNAGTVLVLPDGLKWQQLSLTPSEMSWLESRKLSRREIALVFGVPPEMLGDTDTKTYASYGEARASFYHETVLPYLDRLRDHLNGWLVPQFGDGLYLDYDRDDIEALHEDRSAVWSRVQNADWLTVNEKRRATGYDDIGTEGDIVLINAGMMPLHVVAPPDDSKEPDPADPAKP
jgi:HK97 family phage portal protein